MIFLTLYTKGSSVSTNIVVKQVNMTSLTEDQIYQKYRYYELKVYNSPLDVNLVAAGNYFITAIFDRSGDANLNAWLNILRTLFILIVLFISALLIGRDSRKLILGPMKKMMQKIQKIQENPVLAAKEEKINDFYLKKKLKKSMLKRRQYKLQSQYETSALSNTLVKSGELLALGLGEAGSQIIIKNLKRDKLNALIPGKKVICIFGFCDIKNFTMVNEELKENIMKFVNDIAEIVHFIVDKNIGTTNKNIGEAFLLVWKFPDSDIETFVTYNDDGVLINDIALKEYK